jgi:hypothetical protein
MKKAVLEHWVPALITAGLGGLLVAVITPAIQGRYAERAALAERKMKVWESTGQDLDCFVSSHFQLVTIAQQEDEFEKSGKALGDQELKRKEEYRASRDNCAYKVRADLQFAGYYFGDPVGKVTKDYNDWLSTIRTATVEQMPPRAEFDGWRDKIMKTILNQLSGQ